MSLREETAEEAALEELKTMLDFAYNGLDVADDYGLTVSRNGDITMQQYSRGGDLDTEFQVNIEIVQLS